MPRPSSATSFSIACARTCAALPGVQAAGWTDNVPLQGGSSQYVAVEGQPPMKESEMPVVAVRMASPGYFAASKIQLLAGRDFTDADGYGKPAVMIVSEGTAKRFFPNQDPIGRHITLTMMTKEPATIVGVVREVKLGALDASEADSETAVYAPAAQFAFNGSTIVTPHCRRSGEHDPIAHRRRARRRSGAARARHRHDGGDRRGVARPTAVRDGVAGRVCDAGAGAGQRRHLQRAGLHGAAARARDRHPHGAWRANRRRAAADRD